MGDIKILNRMLEALEDGDVEHAKFLIKEYKDLVLPVGTQTFRVKMGKQPYDEEHRCSVEGCGATLERDTGLYLRLERYADNKEIILAICQDCLDANCLYARTFTFEQGQDVKVKPE